MQRSLAAGGIVFNTAALLRAPHRHPRWYEEARGKGSGGTEDGFTGGWYGSFQSGEHSGSAPNLSAGTPPGVVRLAARRGIDGTPAGEAKLLRGPEVVLKREEKRSDAGAGGPLDFCQIAINCDGPLWSILELFFQTSRMPYAARAVVMGALLQLDLRHVIAIDRKSDKSRSSGPPAPAPDLFSSRVSTTSGPRWTSMAVPEQALAALQTFILVPGHANNVI